MLRRRMLIMLAVVLLIVLTLGGIKAFSIYKQIQMFSAPKPPVSVAAAVAEERQWQERLPAIGSLKAFQGRRVEPGSGRHSQIAAFRVGPEGQGRPASVATGPRPETALLGTAQADLGLAKVDFGRGSQLVGDSAISAASSTASPPSTDATRPSSTSSRPPWPRKASARPSAAPSVFARWTWATTSPAAQ